MRCLERDTQWVLVSFFVEKRELTDEEGRLTGRHEVVRTEPMPLRCSVSASKGTAESSPFGIDLDYDRTVLIEDTAYPIDEASVLWIDDLDQSALDALSRNVADASALGMGDEGEGADDAFSQTLTTKPHDYVVKRVARCPNCLAVAAKRVEVSS